MVNQQLFNENGLTRRQSEVLTHLMSGMSNIEIGNALFVCEKTVKFHINALLKRFECKNRRELMMKLSKSWKFNDCGASNEIMLPNHASVCTVSSPSELRDPQSGISRMLDGIGDKYGVGKYGEINLMEEEFDSWG